MGLLVLLNNYLHDLATGAWLSANVFQLAILRGGRGKHSRETLEALGVARRASRVALVWIILGGIIRAAAYREYEWSDAAGRKQVGLLGVKHLLLFAMVALGLAVERQVDQEWEGDL